ncbi:serine hydrolase domain-containing protein [Phytoactinopolyspora halotolerans]|uniref:Beta-lactamase family protein n=1 Tax=Phytoactinopolyspora halotolerans TaxID=1981512 RepID=A0A6L9SEC7_9ACTN|nr:serine hydrolase domain-containing protein [Phytoactinopolyspora halotolerans]NEE03409.1 beta-lactamase family protein [Phytoactinopolyspora halotolerans]
MESLRMIEQWPVDNAAAAVVAADGTVLDSHGDGDRVFKLASVTKLLTAYAALLAVEEGVAELDDPAGPEGSTIRHLLAHTSGLNLNDHTTIAPVGNRRVYSSAGYEQLADELAKRSGIDFADYVREGLLTPLGMASTVFEGSPGHGASSTVNDLVRFAAELQRPSLLDPSTVATATTVAFPGLAGVLPGYGRQDPNDWGLGFEIRDHKSPHWTGAQNSPATYGHFGQSGTFLWVDPEARSGAGLACVVLTDRDFGDWAIEAWPPLSDAVLTSP